MRFVAVVKEDCPTCRLVVPALAEMRADGLTLDVVTQDEPAFPRGLAPRHDADLMESHKLAIEIVPTVVAYDDSGTEQSRIYGWNKQEWRTISGLDALAEALPANMPGCGALNMAPGVVERLALKAGEIALAAREIPVADDADPIEIAYDRGWTDGFPIVPPTDLRVARMLSGTSRKPDDIIGLVPPNLIPCTVEKAAINAVMAGCRPEYLPMVIGALETALEPEFAMHGLLCTLAFS
ncbi:MAG: thioredoxin family protein, partial [Alphaproteobacteria bacterium]